MVILGILPYRFLPVQIGGQKASEQFYGSLGKKVPVVIVSTENNDVSAARNFIVKPVFKSSAIRYGNPFYLKTISRIIRETKATHLFIEHPYMGWMALYLKRKHRIPLAVRSQNIEGNRFKSIGKWWWKILWQYEKFIHRAADFNFFITGEDRDYAIKEFGLWPQKAFVASYGTEVKESPSQMRRSAAKKNVCETLGVAETNALLLFNGSFDYQPNADALRVLIENILPVLNKKSFAYTLIICGRNIPRLFKDAKPAHVVFLDYVPDIFHYNLATDVFVNPVTDGGGIKTKLVEALAAGANAVSAAGGAYGVDPSYCNGKLMVVADTDYEAFADAVCKVAFNHDAMWQVFYQHFYIENITDHVIETIDAK